MKKNTNSRHVTVTLNVMENVSSKSKYCGSLKACWLYSSFSHPTVESRSTYVMNGSGENLAFGNLRWFQGLENKIWFCLLRVVILTSKLVKIYISITLILQFCIIANKQWKWFCVLYNSTVYLSYLGMNRQYTNIKGYIIIFWF